MGTNRRFRKRNEDDATELLKLQKKLKMNKKKTTTMVGKKKENVKLNIKFGDIIRTS